MADGPWLMEKDPTFLHHPSSMSPDLLESKSIGALLGTFTGDALGMPVEGYTYEMIVSAYGQVTELLPARLGLGTYTDDTQLMIGAAESLIECGVFKGEHMANRFVANFDSQRGYGRGAVEVIYRLSQGVPWRSAGAKLFGGGSFGNGGAMRIAPVGVMYFSDTDLLLDTAEKTAKITHTHLLGWGGAVLQALAVGLSASSEPATPLDTDSFLNELVSCIQPEWEAYQHKLEHVRELLSQPFDEDEVIERLGNDISTQGSVPTAIYCFLHQPDSFEDAVLTAVNLGGDTDTIGAMTGALSGARLGYEAIPAEWRDQLENGQSGRDYVMELGKQLAEHASKILTGLRN